MSEQAMPKCPYCGEEMRIAINDFDMWHAWCRKCGAEGPKEDKREEAIAAALRRPMQKPLTLDDLQHYVTEPVWTSRGWGVVGLHKTDECNYRYVIGFAHGWEWAEDVFRRPVWASKPTDEERAAAKWEEAAHAK